MNTPEQNDHLKSMLNQIKNLPFHPNDDTVPELRRRIEELEAACAVMREALEFAGCHEHYDAHMPDGSTECSFCKAVDQALSTTAGAAFLVRIKTMEAALKAAVEAMEKSKDTFGHEHWDETMEHGKGCPKCIKQTESLKVIGHALALAKACGVEVKP